MTTTHSLPSIPRKAICAAVAATCFGLAAGAHAAASITGIEMLQGSLGGTLNSFSIDNVNNTISIDKTLTSIDSLTLRITVGHGTGGGNQFSVSESIANATGQDWKDYHLSVAGENGVVFNQFSQSTLGGFTLDSAPSSGPTKLNFTGALAAGGNTTASFLLNPHDPGAGKSYTFDLIQTPSITGGGGGGPGGNPVPVPAAVWLLGSGLLFAPLRRARRREDTAVA